MGLYCGYSVYTGIMENMMETTTLAIMFSFTWHYQPNIASITVPGNYSHCYSDATKQQMKLRNQKSLGTCLMVWNTS